MTISEETDLELIQKRPAMYVGGINAFGLKNIIMGAVKLLLDTGPTFVQFTSINGQLELLSDARLSLSLDSQGLLIPFERFRLEKQGVRHDSYGAILNALSESFELSAHSGNRLWALKTKRGQRISLHVEETARTDSPTLIRWTPLADFLHGETISPTFWQSWLQRLSFLCPQIRFTLRTEQGEFHYSHPQGLRDLFAAVAAPYLLTHSPIHFRVRQDSVQLEAVWAIHTRREDVCLSFINKVQAFDGGTHEQGQAAGLQTLRSHLGHIEDHGDRPGILCVMFVEYPQVEWHGSQRQKVANAELSPIIENLLVSESVKWLEKHPEVANQIKQQKACTWEGFL